MSNTKIEDRSGELGHRSQTEKNAALHPLAPAIGQLEGPDWEAVLEIIRIQREQDRHDPIHYDESTHVRP